MSDQPSRGLPDYLTTLSDVTDWTDVRCAPIDDPVDLRTATTGPRSSDPRDKRMPR